MNKFYTFYHNDLDGKSAAWCVHTFLRNIGVLDKPNQYQRHGYADEWKLNNIDKDTNVFIVDLSFTKDTVGFLIEICTRARNVFWIDHHQSSLDLVQTDTFKSSFQPHNLCKFLSNNGSGALLTYAFTQAITLIYDLANECDENAFDNIRKYYSDGTVLFNFDDKCFHVDFTNTTGEMADFSSIPKWLDYVDDYDRWQKRYVPDTDNLVLGIETANTGFATKIDEEIVFNDDFWKRFMTNGCIDNYISIGTYIKAYMDSRHRKELRNCFEYTLDDGTIILCKNGYGNSWNFMDEIKKYPAVCLFSFDGKNGIWYHSVYSDAESDFDCAKFCQQFGGGGHKHAAGFQNKKAVFVPEL